MQGPLHKTKDKRMATENKTGNDQDLMNSSLACVYVHSKHCSIAFPTGFNDVTRLEVQYYGSFQSVIMEL